MQSQLSETLFESISKKTKKCHSHENGKLTKKTIIMKTIENAQCPNCWGYQTYDEQHQAQQLCECKA
ncbi:hypothetical protein BTO15_06355 [Polaribacter sejongensis]|uniref:Uncharacterized protein n=1 Tax=Polaribacter sejongensis TaxID=985043 RepID=A0ABN5FBQ1_9FLAO|nr:hypothetical protein BTO15_06355 [Polaribacter sejongensis]